MAVLEILCGGREGEDFQFSKVIYVGSGAEVELRLQDDGISRKHAKVEIDGSKLTLTDLGSANGTYVNFKRLDKNSAASIKDRDIIFFGRTVTKFWLKKPTAASSDNSGLISDEDLKTLLRGSVPIKALEKLNNPALVAAARKLVLDAERVEVMRRLGFGSMSASEVEQLLSQAKA